MMRHMLIAVAVTMLRTSAGSSDFGFPTTIGGAISDWTLQLDVDTSHCQYTGVPRYFTALVGDSGVYRLHGEHVVYRSTARGFRVYVVADRFITTTIAERKRWAVAWMGTTDSRSGTSSMDWHIVRDASNNVQQMHGASGGSGVGVYIDVSTKVSGTALLAFPANRRTWRHHR